MILRDIFVGLDRAQYPTEVAYPFKLRSRCLCHFIGRHIWKKQIRVPGFNRVVVELSKDAVPKFSVNVCQVACISMPLKHTGFQDFGDIALQEFFIDALVTGVDQFLTDYPDALAAIHEAIALFREGGYKEEWITRSRRFADLGLAASLSCSMTLERFALRLIVFRSKRPVYDQEIFSSDPDEVAFAHRFKDVVVKDGEIVVIDRFAKALLALTFQEIEENRAPNKRTTDNSGASPLRV